MGYRMGRLFSGMAAVFAALHGFTVWAGEPQRSALEGVPGLEKRVTYAETKIPLGELVEKIAADTGCPLTAARAVADEPVALAVTDFPARDLLQELADLFDYRWRRPSSAVRIAYSVSDKGGRAFDFSGYAIRNTLDARDPAFEIYQDLAARNREAALRERQRRAVEARFREELKQRAEIAALPDDAFQRLLTAAADRLRQRQTPSIIASSLSTAEAREQMRRDEAVHELQSPVQRTLALLFNQLPAEQWDRLLATGRLILSTKPEPGEFPVPAEIEQRLRASGPTWRTHGWWQEPSTAEDEEGYREDDRQRQAAWTAAGGYRATLDLDPNAFQWHANLNLEARVEPLRGPESLAPSTLPSTDNLGVSPGSMFQVSASAYDLRDPAEELTPEQRAGLTEDPVFGAIAQYRPLRSSPPLGTGPPAAEKSFQEYLPALARLYHVSFLADAYWGSPRLGSDALPAEPTPLYALLERLMSSTHRWDRRDRLVRLRSRTWFMERPCEVPLRLVRQWNNLSAQSGALSLDTFATCAATLSDGQTDSLNYLIEVAGLSKDFAMVPAGRQGLRFYATLTPGQRQALWLHQPVVLARLTRAQRALMVETLHEGYRVPQFMVRPEWLANVWLSQEEEPLMRVRRQQGTAITEQDFPLDSLELAASGGSAQAALPATGAAKAVTLVTGYPVARVSLTIHYDGDWSVRPLLIVSPP
jgi:hypothetical protein